MTETSHSLARSQPPDDWQRGFWSLILTQFQVGFNDNGLKFLVTYIVIGMNLPQPERDRLVPIVGALFAIPFILFSMTGGYFADRYSKRSVTIGMKILELGVMLFFILSLALRNLPMECAGVFLISTEGALFGPSKYGLLPELLPEPKLSWGNGIIEFGTFLAGIGGTIAAGELAERYRGREVVAGFLLMACSLIGLTASLGISRVPAANPEKKFRWNPLGDFLAQIKTIAADRVLGWAVFGNTYLFFLAALLQLAVIIYGHDVLRIDEAHITYLQAAIAVGIGLGSVAAGYLSRGKIEYGLIPLGAVGMTLFGGLLYFRAPAEFLAGRFETIARELPRFPDQVLSLAATWAHLRVFDLGLLGFFGGLFAVPLGALIQHRPRPEQKGGVIAAANLVSFIGIALASLAYYVFTNVFHQTAAGIFLDGAILTLVTTVFSIWLLPDSLLRFLLWVATSFAYRIRVEGRENVPESGGALFVSNHLSFVDALLLAASTDRSIRFLMFKGIYELPYVKPFAKIMRAIPISSEQRPREMIHSLREATNAIKNGEVVCIFAEGQITRIGHLLPFRRGMQHILKGVDAPIVPVSLEGVWGSIFSFERGRFLWKLPRTIPYPVTVSFGKPLPPTASPVEVRRAVEQLQSEAFRHRKSHQRTLHRSFIHKAHRHPFRFAMADKRRPRLVCGYVLLSAIFLARRLRRTWAGQQMIGILLPPSVPAALVNLAAALSGKVPVNLNYTLSNEALASCVAQCQIETILTTKLLLEKIPLKLPGQVVLLEEVVAQHSLGERIVALLLWFLPGSRLESLLSGGKTRHLDDLATVVFSSGSTGDPKGVMLTHYNIVSNIEQMGQTFLFGRKDSLLGVLPFFHSFGFTVTLWLPLVLGVSVVYHPSPLDLAAIGELVRDYGVTFLLATPTFLEAYVRRCSPEDFGSLQCVLVGAEKLPERLALRFQERFGIRPLEGYGTTECSPVVAVNTKDFRAAGLYQVGAKRGSIGHPLPGIRVRIVDPETSEPVPDGRAGLLMIQGPNVMQGYLGKPETTREVLREGWYITGDIAAEDEDGFLSITDRLGRFSKIGGEMVPHIQVEEQLQQLAGANDQKIVVTAVPDAKKGERLVVLHTLNRDELKPVLENLSRTGLPNLWIPRPKQFFFVEQLPHLGTGKLDLRRIRELALEFSAGDEP